MAPTDFGLLRPARSHTSDAAHLPVTDASVPGQQSDRQHRVGDHRPGSVMGGVCRAARRVWILFLQ